MKKLLLTSIAALFLATGAVAESPDDSKWTASFRRCEITKTFAFHSKTVVDSTLYGENGGVHADNSSATVSLRLEDVLAIQKELPTLKKCDAFYTCVYKRDYLKHYASPGTSDPVKPGEKRPKHCYENDRRWR